jgi:hypothetical protein
VPYFSKHLWHICSITDIIYNVWESDSVLMKECNSTNRLNNVKENKCCTYIYSRELYLLATDLWCA